MNKKAWLASRALRVGAGSLAEKVRPSVPRTATDVPANGRSLTNEWLTDVLCGGVPDAEVIAWHSPGGSSGTSERAALRVEYNQAGRAANLPTQLYTKSSDSFQQRMMLGAARFLDGETQFYLTYRPKVDMEAPQGYWGGVDPASWRSLVIIENITETKGAHFIDANEPLTRTQIEDVLANMAAYHGTWWDNPQLATLKSPIDHFRNVGDFIDMERRCRVGMDLARDVIPHSLHGLADRLWEGTRASLALLTSQTPTLLHGDSHVGQTYVTADGRMGLTDWQTTLRGNWAYDVAYFVGSACEPDDRRAWEADLLRHYLTRLAAAGGQEPSFEDAMLAYRRSMFYPYSAWSFTIGRAWYQPKMQSVATCLTVLRRLSTAIDDLASFEAMGI